MTRAHTHVNMPDESTDSPKQPNTFTGIRWSMTLKVRVDVLVSSPSEGIYSPTSQPYIADKIVVRTRFSFFKKHADNWQNTSAMIDITSTVNIKHDATAQLQDGTDLVSVEVSPRYHCSHHVLIVSCLTLLERSLSEGVNILQTQQPKMIQRDLNRPKGSSG